MNALYQHSSFIKRFIVSVSFSLVLLCIRIVKTDSGFFLFLVWNLFLACIPYFITLLLSIKKHHSLFFWPLFFVWLIFLPNSPYILTDLQHIRISTLSLVWFDVLLILSFAINGLIIGFASLHMMQTSMYQYCSKKITRGFINISFILCGFGIYLGRVLRWNSWDILQNPIEIIGNIAKRIFFPIQHIDTWAFTLGFGIFLFITYQLTQKNFEPKRKQILD